jgi:hypothetical protein
MATKEDARNIVRVLNWPAVKDAKPFEPASIYLMFHGLMCFAYNNTTALCEVGMHSKARDHDFKLFAFEMEGQTIIQPAVYSFEPESHNDVPGGIVTIDIEEPITPGVRFHFPDFDEENNSWKRLVDLEGGDFYDRKLEKKKNVLKPMVTINHGLFFVIPTDKRFLKIEEGTPSQAEIGKIGFIAVSTAKHTGTGTITIKTQREELTLHGSVAKPILIFITNICPQDECPPVSDFQQYYKAFRIHGDERKFKLEVITDSAERLNLGKLAFFANAFETEPLRHMVSSNDAPCGPGGYGRSSGLNDSGP